MAYNLYYKNRCDLKFGDLLQWDTEGNVVSAAIKAKTADDRPQWEKDHGINVSHSSLVITLPLYEGADRRVWTIEATGEGTVLHLLSKRLLDFTGKLWWYPLKDDIGCDHYRQVIGERALEFLGTPYDYADLFHQAVERVKVDTLNLFCSEFCQVCYLGQAADGMVALNPNEMASLEIFKDPILIFDRPLQINTELDESPKENQL